MFEVSIRQTLAEPVRLTVSAKKLFEIVRELPDEKIELEGTTSSYLEIRCNRSRFTLAGTAAEEYPTLPEFSPEKTVPMPAAILSAMIECTMYAASVDETRYNLNGVYFEVLGDNGASQSAAVRRARRYPDGRNRWSPARLCRSHGSRVMHRH